MTYRKKAGLSAFDTHVQCNTLIVAFNAVVLCCKRSKSIRTIVYILNFATDRNMKKLTLMIAIECCERP